MKNKFLYNIWTQINSLMGHELKSQDTPQQSANKVQDKIDVFETYGIILDDQIKCLNNIIEIEDAQNEKNKVETSGYWRVRFEVLSLKKQRLDLEVEKYAKKDFIHNYENRKKFYEEYNKELTERAGLIITEAATELERLLPFVPNSKDKILAYGKLHRLVAQELTVPQRNQLFLEIEDLVNSLKHYEQK